MAIFVSRLDGWVNPADLFIGLHGNDDNAFWLDRQTHPTHRFSVIGGTSEVLSGGVLAHIRKELTAEESVDVPFEFRPGLVGYIDYEGNYQFLKIDRALVLDHDNQQIHFIGDFENQEKFDYWKSAALLRIGVSGGEQAMYKRRTSSLVASTSKVLHSDDHYLSLIRLAQKRIELGDVYQICLTNQIQLNVSGDALHTFLLLREVNPAPFSSFIRVNGLELISCSPEQFLHVNADSAVSSKPIKGTRPRGKTVHDDQRLAKELLNDSKERAENLMIVDLMRNDFAKVSEADSVTVPSLYQIESYATVHQLVSTVQAKLAQDKDIIDLIDSVFPGGSMTGAPKIRAMQIIRELEGAERGVYSGAIGYITKGSVVDFGMVIRTIEVSGDQARIGVGGGITIDSQPELELKETKIKAAALLKVLQAQDPWANW